MSETGKKLSRKNKAASPINPRYSSPSSSEGDTSDVVIFDETVEEIEEKFVEPPITKKAKGTTKQ